MQLAPDRHNQNGQNLGGETFGALSKPTSDDYMHFPVHPLTACAKTFQNPVLAVLARASQRAPKTPAPLGFGSFGAWWRCPAKGVASWA